ncbi:MAG: bifunctional isocitrate dehydrogenase kinase/phosphatase [Acidimicrobiia bacterium]
MSATVAVGFHGFRSRFRSATRRANARFEARDWASLRRDHLDRMDAYGDAVDATLDALAGAGVTSAHRESWASAKSLYRDEVSTEPFPEIAETFFNSVTRRMFDTKGTDARVEFLSSEAQPAAEGDEITRVYSYDGNRRELLAALLRDCRFQATWADLPGDLDEGAGRLPDVEGTVEVCNALFFRGKGAYVVGRFVSATAAIPFALAIRHGRSGLRLGAVLVGEGDLAILFSYTRAAFLVDSSSPSALVAFLWQLLPGRRRYEVFASIGFRKQAKTENFRELASHMSSSDDRFVFTPGVPGLVMIVFTLESYDVVFKVIRDRFPPQKTVTPPQVKERYRLVNRHDRAGRLVEAQRFIDLRLPKSAFDVHLLSDLLENASRTATIDGEDLLLSLVYVERQVIPLDVFVRSASVEEASEALIDYGDAIKNLAASNIFPGDMLLKNFGVTNRGRVVFYDYDEIGLVTDLRFRSFPQLDEPNDAMSVTPAFGVGPNDVFPEELPRFLGLSGAKLETLYDYHADLFDTEFWEHVQARLQSGEIIEILPYRRSRALEQR